MAPFTVYSRIASRRIFWALVLVGVLWGTYRGFVWIAFPRTREVPITVKPTADSPTTFVEVTEAAGIKFTYRNGEESDQFSMLELVGGGVSARDFDVDGWCDLFFPGGGQITTQQQIRGLPGAFYRNRNGKQWEAMTGVAGLDRANLYSHGANAGDYNDDGFPDLLVTGWQGCQLFENQGDGTFRERSRAARIGASSYKGKNVWGNSSAWGDVNGDGVTDLYIAQYLDWNFSSSARCRGGGGKRDLCRPQDYGPLPDRLFLGLGDGTFESAPDTWGVRRDGKGLGVVMADLDGNGTLDIYVANDTNGNFLYRNEKNKLLEMGFMSGSGLDAAGAPDGSMGTDVGDVDHDGLPDIVVSNYEREIFAIYRQLGDLQFLHLSEKMGLGAIGGLFIGWGVALQDWDSDTDLDFLVVHGHVNRYPTLSSRRQKPWFCINQNGTWFENVAPNAGEYFTQEHNARGLATGDFDRDGDVDVAISHLQEPAALLLNQQPKRHWLGLELIGTRATRDPVGAVVHIHVDGKVLLGLAKGGGSYLSTHDPTLFFGLGEKKRIDRMEIHWPSGTRQTLTAPAVDQHLLVKEPITDAKKKKKKNED